MFSSFRPCGLFALGTLTLALLLGGCVYAPYPGYGYYGGGGYYGGSGYYAPPYYGGGVVAYGGGWHDRHW